MINARISPLAKVHFEGQIYLHPSSLVIASVNIGAYSYFGNECMIGGCIVGRFCSIGPGVKIGLGEHETNHISTHPFFFGSKHGFNIPDGIGLPRDMTQKKHSIPRIGHDVWIGANAIIRRGVNIGTGAVIAAGAVVNKDIQPYSIVGGVPAKHISFRFDEPTINDLLQSQWWEYDLTAFIGLDVCNPAEFLRKLNLLDNKKFANYPKRTQNAVGEVI